MPFTPSHIAAVLPFVRRPVTGWAYAPAALAIGSMIPDVPLFTRRWPAYAETHSVKGILTVDVLATCAVVALYYLVFRTALLQLLPRAVGDRIRPPTRLRQPAHLVWVPVAAVFGAATHAFWDSFTHARSVTIWGSALGTQVLGLPLYKLLQYLSGLFGLIVLAAWALFRLRRFTPQPSPGLRLGSRTRVTALALLVVATGIGAVWSVLTTPHPDELAWHLHWAAIGGCSLAALATTAYAALFTVVQAAARTISGRALPPRSETTASGVPSGPSTP
ncbi:MAG: DUF4184 family protein [Hamadaea sp.]|uniref:DUF4184 family protein n=1 Tax=Hamadaea sp. TaxID=2024425 RepID=UPI0018001156|nr:DUF4184 family protein [Hamadaea sp.]NUR73531.1 DUF4184 family protein [Hamadaea sp.]NUT19768.1 DUF4184 family protein [Hamadaea sp.]